tara:strand:- start:9404 stop:9922 length:519 start_codon:yes stop_codon:yes gene_type:complete
LIEAKNSLTAAGWIKHGKVIAYPTEGVWGLGCLNEKKAIQKLNSIKGRNKEKKYILLFHNLEQAFDKLKIEHKFKDQINKLSKSFTTIIVPTGENTVAIRIPKYKVLLDLLDGVGSEIISTSANISGQQVCRNATEVKEVFSDRIFGILNLPLGGQKKPSKIFDIENNCYVR